MGVCVLMGECWAAGTLYLDARDLQICMDLRSHKLESSLSHRAPQKMSARRLSKIGIPEVVVANRWFCYKKLPP